MSLNIIIIIDLFVHCSAGFVGKINIVLYTVYCLFYCFLLFPSAEQLEQEL